MNKIKGDVGAALDAVYTAVMDVVLNMGLDVYGPVSQDTGLKIAGALGTAITDIQVQAELGAFSGRNEEEG